MERLNRERLNQGVNNDENTEKQPAVFFTVPFLACFDGIRDFHCYGLGA
jgi:hypothetical protein